MTSINFERELAEAEGDVNPAELARRTGLAPLIGHIRMLTNKPSIMRGLIAASSPPNEASYLGGN